MLVLTRKKNEEIVIGENIRIKVLDVQGDRVSIGFEAPPEIPIHRKEVYERIREQSNFSEQRRAGHASTGESQIVRDAVLTV